LGWDLLLANSISRVSEGLVPLASGLREMPKCGAEKSVPFFVDAPAGVHCKIGVKLRSCSPDSGAAFKHGVTNNAA